MEEKGGKLIIISAPSGAGKTTIVNYLMGLTELNLEFSISACNRRKREHEVDGVDYYFMSTEEFLEKADNNEFLEWEEVYENHYYGTLKSEIERIFTNNKNIIFDVDVIGGIDLKQYFGDKAISIFIKPPSIEILEERLKNRETEDQEETKLRLKKVRDEMQLADIFDHIIVNNELIDALTEIENIITKFLDIKIEN